MGIPSSLHLFACRFHHWMKTVLLWCRATRVLSYFYVWTRKSRTPNSVPEQIEDEVRLTLNLPYAGDVGEKIIKKMQRYVERRVNTEDKKINVSATYNSTRLSTRFNLKDRTKLEHKHNVTYYVPCPNKKCKSDYIGETKRRTEKRSEEHRGKDKKSHVSIHSEKTKHKRVSLRDFKILGQGYRSNFRRKISESLFIKSLKPNLNVQKDSYKLTLFN